MTRTVPYPPLQECHMAPYMFERDLNLWFRIHSFTILSCWTGFTSWERGCYVSISKTFQSICRARQIAFGIMAWKLSGTYTRQVLQLDLHFQSMQISLARRIKTVLTYKMVILKKRHTGSILQTPSSCSRVLDRVSSKKDTNLYLEISHFSFLGQLFTFNS